MPTYKVAQHAVASGELLVLAWAPVNVPLHWETRDVEVDGAPAWRDASAAGERLEVLVGRAIPQRGWNISLDREAVESHCAWQGISLRYVPTLSQRVALSNDGYDSLASPCAVFRSYRLRQGLAVLISQTPLAHVG
jgi:hypothetical protein